MLMRRYFNWTLFVVLVLGLAVLAATALGLRHWQRGRRSSAGLKIGSKAYEQGQWNEAANQLGRYLAIVQDDIPVLLKYADSQLNIRPLKEGNIQQAIAAYRNILRLAPGHVEAATRLTELYLGVGMSGDAELVAGRALQSSQTPELQRLMALALAGQRKFKDAAAELEKIIKNNPDEIYAYDSLGRLVEQRPEDFSVTPQFWFEEAVKNNPDSAMALICRGAFHRRQDQTAQAIADFNLAASKNCDGPNVRIQLAEQLVGTGRLQQARQHLEIAEAVDPSNQLLWRVWASLAIASGSRELMSEVAQRASKQLERQPWDFMPIAAELYIRSGRLEEAADCISQLRQKDITPVTTEFLNGLLADANGQWYEAVRCWQRAIDLGKQPETLRFALARTFLKLGDRQSAIKQLRVLVSEEPKFVAARIELARLLGEAGKWAESMQHSRIAVELAPDDANAGFAYALARSRLAYDEQGGANVQEKIDLENYTRKLELATGGSIEVKLLRLQLAVNRPDFNEARRILNEIKNLYPSDTRVVIAEADLLFAEGKAGQAMNLLTDSLEKTPDSVALVRACISNLWAKNEKQRCVDIVNRAFEQGKTTSAKKQMGFLLAGLYAGLNQPAKQCELLSRLCVEFPKDITVLRSMLTCPEVMKNPAQSQQLIDTIKTLEGDAGGQWRYEQARFWFNAKDFNAYYPQIVAILKENLLKDPDDQPSRMLLAAAYEKAKDIRLAIATYDEAIRHSPGDAQIVVQAAAAMYQAGEYDRADKLIRNSAEITKKNPRLKQLQLQSFIRTADFDSAAVLLEDIFAADRKNQSAGLSLALLKIQQGQLDDAEKLLNDLIADDPDFLPAVAAKVEMKIRNGASEEAIRICDKLVERLNNSSALVLRGKTAAMLGQNDTAAADFDRAVSIEPNSIEPLLARSDFYRSVGHDAEAASDIKRAMLLEPDNVRIQKRAILLYLAADPEQIRQGLVLLDDALQSNPDDLELRIYKAQMLVALQTSVSLEQASSILEDIKKEHPATSEVWKLLAETALRRGKPADALNIVLEGLVRLPKDKELLLLKAQIEGQHSPHLAVPTLTALHELDPNDVQVTTYLADTLVAAGQYEHAMDLLNSQLNVQEKAVDRRMLQISLGTALYKSSKHKEASEIFDSLEKSSPDDPVPLLVQVRLLSEDKLWPEVDGKIKNWLQSHPDDVNVAVALARQLASDKENEPVKIAEDLLRRVIESKPNSASAGYSLALLLQTVGRTNEAVGLYRQVLKNDPKNVVALNNLAWILCEDQKQYRQALDLADKGLEIEPNYVDLLDTRGVTLYRLGLYQRAADDLSRCILLYPPDSRSLAATNFHLARIQEKLGQTDRATETLKKALDLNNEKEGLTADDLAEAKKLLDKLSKGS
ncbi:MAG: tetratricopeptide repeat protein [Sedimentisphaerales bacterium]|nr:tetratricopeptide repeat protein [Sedimentisphaerales bacterium]